MGGKNDKNNKKTDDDNQTEEETPWWKSVLNFLNPFSDGVSFGSLFNLLIMAASAYFIMATDTGKKLVGSIFGEDAKNTVSGWWDKAKAWLSGVLPDSVVKALGWENATTDLLDKSDHTQAADLMKGYLSPDMIAIVTKDDQTWNSLKAAVKAANNGMLSFNTFTNEKTILALITSKKPELQTMTSSLLTSMTASSSTPLSDVDKKNRTTLLTDLRTLVAGSGLTEMLNPQNRQNTLSLLTKILPGLDGSVNTEAAFNIPKLDLLDATGAPSARLRALLTKQLMPDPTSNALPPAKDMLKSLLDCDAVRTDPTTQQQVVNLLIKPQLAKVIGASNVNPFINALGNARTIEFSLITLDQNPLAEMGFVMKPENLTAFKKFADTATISDLPQEWQGHIQELKNLNASAIAPLGHCADVGVDPQQIKAVFVQTDKNGHDLPVNAAYVMNNLLNATNRAMFNTVGTECVAELVAAQKPEYKDLLSKHNLDVLLAAANKVDTDASNNQQPAATHAVLNAFVSYAMNSDTTQLAKLDANQIATFFKNPANRTALDDVINGIQGLKGDASQMLTALKKDWDVSSGQHGLVAVLADPAGAAFFKEQLVNPSSGTGVGWLDNLLTVAALKWGQDGTVKAEREYIMDFQNTLKVIHVSHNDIGRPVTGTNSGVPPFVL